MTTRVVVDHIAGSRRGQRQEFDAGARVRFGRHPDCEVSFDPHRDIDASSRHAELRTGDAGWVLVDLGSSNGTYVEGHRVTEVAVAQNMPMQLEFGPGGPRVRLFVGDDTAVEGLPPPVLGRKRRPAWLAIAIASVVVAAMIGVAVARC